MSHDKQVTNTLTDSVSLKDNAAAQVLPEHTQHMLDEVYKGKLPEKRFDPTEDTFIQKEKTLKELIGTDTLIIGTPTASEKDRVAAGKILEKGVSRLIPEADRATMKGMTDAITSGDPHAFAEALKGAHGDPQKIKELCKEVTKSLSGKGSSTRLDVTADGTVVISDGSQNTAVAINPNTGAVSARAVEHNVDGSITLKPGELLNVDTDEAFRTIGDSAVNAVNGKTITFKPELGDLPMPNPFEPFHPSKPIEPFKPLGWAPFHPSDLGMDPRVLKSLTQESIRNIEHKTGAKVN